MINKNNVKIASSTCCQEEEYLATGCRLHSGVQDQGHLAAVGTMLWQRDTE